MANTIISDASSKGAPTFNPPVITPAVWSSLVSFFYAALRMARQVEEYANAFEKDWQREAILNLAKQVEEEAELLKHFFADNDSLYAKA